LCKTFGVLRQVSNRLLIRDLTARDVETQRITGFVERVEEPLAQEVRMAESMTNTAKREQERIRELYSWNKRGDKIRAQAREQNRGAEMPCESPFILFCEAQCWRNQLACAASLSSNSRAGLLTVRWCIVEIRSNNEMSAQEIIQELMRLNWEELKQIDLKLHQLLEEKASTGAKSWGEALLEVAGTVQDLPPDYAENHDHYVHGLSRR
jgi:hypothetical protein